MTPLQILNKVSEETGVAPQKLFAKDRSKYVFAARVRLYRELRELGLSYPEIGKFVGRDHGTIIKVLKRHVEPKTTS